MFRRSAAAPNRPRRRTGAHTYDPVAFAVPAVVFLCAWYVLVVLR